MVNFAYPYLLYLLLLVPAIGTVYAFGRIVRRKRLARFGNPETLSPLMPDVSKYLPTVKIVIELTALALLIIALARPRAGAKEEVSTVNGIEVMVAVDVSNSMLASSTDDPSGLSRLQRAKHVLERLINKLDNDKVGLIVFAGEAYTQLPITSDFMSAKIYLNELSTEMVPTQGTAIGSAINMAMHSFSPNDDVQRAIVVITDGENQTGDAVEMADAAHKAGIEVDVIGLGSGKGAPIPLNRERSSFLKDDDGKVVTTYLNETMARDIAKAGGGIYVNGAASNAVSDIAGQLDKLAKSDLERVVYSASAEQFPLFAWIALLLLLADTLLLNRKIGFLRRYNFFSKGNVAIIAMLLVPVLASAQTPSTKQERNFIRQGNELYKQKRYAEAEKLYGKALEANPLSEIGTYNYAMSLLRQAGSADPNNGNNPLQKASKLLNGLVQAENAEVGENAAYNLGNIAFNASQFDQAIAMYKNALRRNPDNDKARENLRLAQLKKQEQEQQNQNQDQNQDQQQEQNQDQQQNQQDQKDNDQQNQDNNQNQQQDRQQQPDKQEQQGSISPSNAQKILEAAEKAEAATRAKVEAERKKEEAKAAGRPRGNQW